MNETISHYIGRDAETIQWWQMSIRAVVVFAAATAFIRLGGIRAFGSHTSFDIVFGVLLGSNLSRALTGNAPLFPTLAACAALVVLHRLIAQITIRSSLISRLIKGRATLIVESGEPKLRRMRRLGVGTHDIEEAVRKAGQEGGMTSVRKAYLERSGNITIIPD